MSRRLTALVASLIVGLLVVAYVVRQDTPPPAASAPSESSEPDLGEPLPGEEQGGRGNPEAAEQAETTEKRLEALDQARLEGTLAVDTSALASSPAAR